MYIQIYMTKMSHTGLIQFICYSVLSNREYMWRYFVVEQILESIDIAQRCYFCFASNRLPRLTRDFFFLLKQFMNTFDWFGTFVLLFISLRGWRIYIYIYIVYQTWDKVYVMNIVLANLSACVRTPVFSFSFFNFLFSAVQRHDKIKEM